jgi:hypothetical protein
MVSSGINVLSSHPIKVAHIPAFFIQPGREAPHLSSGGNVNSVLIGAAHHTQRGQVEGVLQ